MIAAVAAEPPRYRPQRQFFFARQQEEATTVSNAPYAPSGWRPSGPAFNLPQRQYGAPSAPQQQYGAPSAPQQQYGAPQQQYGAPAVPQQQYGPPQEATTTEAPSSTEAEDLATTVASVESEVREGRKVEGEIE